MLYAFSNKAQDGIVSREREIPGRRTTEEMNPVECLRLLNLPLLVVAALRVAQPDMVRSALGARRVEAEADCIEGNASGVGELKRSRNEVG